MSFDLKAAGGYGKGTLGDVTFSGGFFNSYYIITAFSGNTFTAAPETARNGDFFNLKNGDDVVGEEFLIHAFAAKSGATAQLGLWRVVKVTSVDYETTPAVFTTDKSLADLSAASYHWQAVWIPHFKNLTLTSANITVFKPTVNASLVTPGGVVAFKCSEYFTMNGGHIDLTDGGLPTDTATTYRPTTSQESHVLDTQLYAGAENSITKDRLLLNCGDGAAFILVKRLNIQSSSRIGNPNSQGVQYCRGATDSKPTHTGSNVGGSTILLACDYSNTFYPAVISKYRTGSGGRGLARAYIAKKTMMSSLLPDDGLYALDDIKNERCLAACGIKDFGNGRNGSATNTTSRSYGDTVHSISSDGKTIKVGGGAVAGYLVLFVQLQKSAGQDPDSGKFFLTRVTNYDSSTKIMTVEDPVPLDPSKYYVQALYLYEYTNLTINKEINGFSTWSSGKNGIVAFVCSDTLDLRGGKINVEGKGTKSSISNRLVGNAFMKDRLYIGQGHGTVFILAKNIIMDSSTRIGATYDGALFGGVAKAAGGYTAQGGYRGADGTCIAETSNCLNSPGGGGWGGGAGSNSYGYNGGFFGNAPHYADYLTDDSSVLYRSYQGAHILIIADTITGLNLSALSTGGKRGGQHNKATDDGLLPSSTDGNGGCGYGGAGAGNVASISGNNSKNYGGAGGYRGGGAGTPDIIASHESNSGNHHFYGGGAAGACYIHCNNVVSQSTTGIITS